MQSQALVCIVSDEVVYGHAHKAKCFFFSLSQKLRPDSIPVWNKKKFVLSQAACTCVLLCDDDAIHFSSVLLSMCSYMSVFSCPISPSLVVESAESSKCRPLWHSYGHNMAFTGSGFSPKTQIGTYLWLLTFRTVFFFLKKNKIWTQQLLDAISKPYLFCFWRYYMVLRRREAVFMYFRKRVMIRSWCASPSFCPLHLFSLMFVLVMLHFSFSCTIILFLLKPPLVFLKLAIDFQCPETTQGWCQPLFWLPGNCGRPFLSPLPISVVQWIISSP